ncbi:MAG: TVP38/TMEM64 family protein [Panacagrimonas sp.]
MDSTPPTAPARRWPFYLAVAVLSVLAVAAAWRFSPLHEYADPKVIAGIFGRLQSSPWAPLGLALTYVAASAVLFPNTVLNVATILSLGMPYGPPSALAASLVAALVFYVLGRRYGEERVRALHIKSVDRLSGMLRKGGVLGMASLRLLPIAPYSIVNLMAGAARVKLLAFTFGTLLGLLPGTLMITAFGHQLRSILHHPSHGQIAILAALVVLLLAAMWWLRRKALGDDASTQTAPVA